MKGLLYQNVANQIKADILSGNYPVNSYLPTETELEEIFGVSKITVRQAVQILADEGYVVKRSGKGTRVISNRLFNKLSKAVSYSTLLEKNHDLEKELLNLEIIRFDKEDEMHQYFKKDCLKLSRIYKLDGQAFIYFNHFFPVVDQSNEEALKEIKEYSIYHWLSNHGHDVSHFQDQFSVGIADAVMMEVLELEDEHLLLRKRLSYSLDNEVIEVSHGYYNSDIMPYMIEYEI